MSPTAGRRLLIVNADDFGLTPGVCAGILRAHRDGIVSSTTALAVGPAFAANARALVDSGLPTGAHLAVIGEDPPVLGASEVPSLVDGRGRFPLSWRTFVRRAALGRVDPEDLRRECSAQLDVLHDAGVRPTHVDAHQNLHLWPSVATVVVDLARERDIPAVRLTRTRRWTPTSLGVRALSARLERRVRRTLELNRDRRLTAREPLAHAHVERRVGPPPVVHREARGEVRLGGRVGGNRRLGPVRRDPRLPRAALRVLAAHDSVGAAVGGGQPKLTARLAQLLPTPSPAPMSTKILVRVPIAAKM